MKEYTVSKNMHGYEIIKKDSFDRNLYLTSLYKGKAVWVYDYTYSKTYKTIDGALKAIKSLMED